MFMSSGLRSGIRICIFQWQEPHANSGDFESTALLRTSGVHNLASLCFVRDRRFEGACRSTSDRLQIGPYGPIGSDTKDRLSQHEQSR